MVARIRTIKPEFPHSESMGKVSRDARLLFVELWTLCDDEGRARGASRMLASLLFPYDDDVPGLIDGWLAELEREGCLRRYVVAENGAESTYIQVLNWCKHQKIDRPSRSKIPAPREDSRPLARAREDSSQDRDLDQGSGPRTKEGTARALPAREATSDDRPEKPPAADRGPDRPDDVAEQVWLDWKKHRRAKRAPVTATVIEGFRREAAKAGISLEQAIAHSTAQGWQGFEAEWFARDAGKRGGSALRPTIVPRSTKPGDYAGPTIDEI